MPPSTSTAAIVEEIARLVPAGPTRFVHRPQLVETETLADDLHRITAHCTVAVGREWLAEELLPKLVDERAADGLLVHGAIATFVDEQAVRSFTRSLGTSGRPKQAAAPSRTR